MDHDAWCLEFDPDQEVHSHCVDRRRRHHDRNHDHVPFPRRNGDALPDGDQSFAEGLDLQGSVDRAPVHEKKSRSARLHHHLHSGFVRRGHSHGLGLDLTDRNGKKQLEIMKLKLSDYNFKDTYHDPFEIDCRAVC